jgi:hypothetical protein
MALVKTGQFIARVPVDGTYLQFAPTAGSAVVQGSPFILTNNGRTNGEVSDIIIVNSIGVEPQDGNDSEFVTNGSFGTYICTMGASFGSSLLNSVAISPLNSTNSVPNGLYAYKGHVGGITSRTLINSHRGASYYVNGTAFRYGPLGTLKNFTTYPTSGVQPQGINAGQAFQLSRIGVSTDDNPLSITILIEDASGKSYTVSASCGSGADLLTVVNNTGSTVYITSVDIVDYYRLSAGNVQRYEVIVATSSLRFDNYASVAAMDSTKALPSWVACGSGSFLREHSNIWIDAQEILSVQLPIPCAVDGTRTVARKFQGMTNNHDTSKYLRPGKSLIFSIAPAAIPLVNSHDIVVAFSTYSEQVTGGAGGEYSYAY